MKSRFSILFAALTVLLLAGPVLVTTTYGKFAFVVMGWAGGFLLYQQGGPLVPLVVPTIALAGSAGVGTAHLGRREWAQKRFYPSCLLQVSCTDDHRPTGSGPGSPIPEVSL